MLSFCCLVALEPTLRYRERLDSRLPNHSHNLLHHFRSEQPSLLDVTKLVELVRQSLVSLDPNA